MTRSLLAAFLSAAIAFGSGAPRTSSQKRVHAGESTLKKRILPADPNKYRAVQDARDWRNPYLTVQANGIDARPISAAMKTPIMSPTDVVAYLEKLPSTAWPYGLVVGVQENGVRGPEDDARIKKKQRRTGAPSRKSRGKSGFVAFSVESNAL